MCNNNLSCNILTSLNSEKTNAVKSTQEQQTFRLHKILVCFRKPNKLTEGNIVIQLCKQCLSIARSSCNCYLSVALALSRTYTHTGDCMFQIILLPLLMRQAFCVKLNSIIILSSVLLYPQTLKTKCETYFLIEIYHSAIQSRLTFLIISYHYKTGKIALELKV